MKKGRKETKIGGQRRKVKKIKGRQKERNRERER